MALSKPTPYQWHLRLGHPSLSKLRGVLPNISMSESFQCEACQLGKHTRSSFPSSSSSSSHAVFDLIHVDVWGPSRVVSRAKFRYYLVIVDDFSCLNWVFLLKERSEVICILQNFIIEIKTQFDSIIKNICTDNACEFKSNTLLQFYIKYGICPQFTCPHTSQQNGIAERKHRQLLDMACTLMIHSCVPAQFWGDAILTACYLINRLPSSSIDNQIPIQVLYLDRPLFSLPPKVFGCTCFVHILGPNKDKHGAQSIKCIFIGYPKHQKGYICFDSHTHKQYISADVTFFESRPYFHSTPSLSDRSSSMPLPIPPVPLQFVPYDSFPSASRFHDPPLVYTRRHTPAQDCPPVASQDVSISDVTIPAQDAPDMSLDLPIALRKGKRQCTLHPISQFVSTTGIGVCLQQFVSALSVHSIPSNHQHVLLDPQWQQAMQDEMETLMQRGA
ncbi:retrovirus-related Pol polyprotein from transposon RE2 isoform X1 [Nymphaea colorata]|uniref:retrovirus-related Pol polyprotein from transposon RE2 isoform X1 n=1 Tax=Nymphaea colorata TaxID=210225 RepID=UPI00129E47F9|nr:retrovirus-related Pol polyprotein from transposon RE2 isoform X1 [Nymphaea colorata]XP_031501802.1 retrovirus-related Pol polyprotein from transposon RE2 isoform X1 [Nymphaea colorata]XP_049936709.1 retrovirus-related Pol polyprotein from transposon RE2 isoform X1 [Nymphaea colorata]